MLDPGSTLVLGEDLAEPALAVAREVAHERAAKIVRAGTAAAGEQPRLSPGGFQRRNFALARAAAEAYLGTLGIDLRRQALEEAAASVRVDGRLQLLAGEPPTVLDGAHNPDAVGALLAALPDVLAPGTPLGLVLGVLEDKDAAAMLAPLLEICERAWFTAPPSSRALSPAALQSLARQLGFDAVVCEPRPARALEQARSWAVERGGAVLATGSIYLVGELLSHLAGAPGAAFQQPGAGRSRG